MPRKPKALIKGARVDQLEASQSQGIKPRSGVLHTERQSLAQEDKEFYDSFKLTWEQVREKYGVKLSKAAICGTFATLEMDNQGKIKVGLNRVLDTAGLKEFGKSKRKRESLILERNPYGREMLLEKRFRETKADDEKLSLKKVLREISGGAFDLGGNASNFPANSTAPWPPNNEFIPLLGGPINKQLYMNDYLAMQAKCFETKNHNPLAKAIVDILTFFTLGKGVQVKFVNPQAQLAWEYFVKRNRLNDFLHMDSDTLTWGGEIMTHKTRFPDGYPRLRHVDPSVCWEIVTDPRDIEIVYYYHLQFPTQWQLTYKPGDEAQAYVIEDIPAEEIIHRRINVTPGEKRGRSDLFNILTWLKRFKDYYDARVTKAQMEESFALKVTVQGSDADVQAYLSDPQNNVVPRPGDKIVQNGAVDHEYMQPSASSAGNATDSIGEAIRGICATGAGLSPEYLGVGGRSGTRATSITKAEPSARKFEDRQTTFKEYIGEIVNFWKITAPDLPKMQTRPSSLSALKNAINLRDWKKAAREIAALVTLGDVQEPVDWSYQVIFPEIGTEDRSAKLKDIATAEALEYVSHERAATMSATELGISDYNFEEEQERIRQWREERQQDQVFANDLSPAQDMLGKGGLKQAQASGGGEEAPPEGSQASDTNFKDNKPA